MAEPVSVLLATTLVRSTLPSSAGSCGCGCGRKKRGAGGPGEASAWPVERVAGLGHEGDKPEPVTLCGTLRGGLEWRNVGTSSHSHREVLVFRNVFC